MTEQEPDTNHPDLGPETGPAPARQRPRQEVLAGVHRTLGLNQGDGLQGADNRPAMVEFRLRNGDWTALPYRSLIEVKLNKNSQWPVTVTFSDRIVRVSGSRMEGLYLALAQHRALVVMEQSERHDQSGWGPLGEVADDEDRAVFIASIEIENRSKRRERGAL